VEDGKQAVNAVLTLNPDALVIDISMPALNGFQAAKQLQTADCRAKVIFLTFYEDRDFLDAAFSAGASSYVNKARLSTDLIPAFKRRCWDESLYPRRYRCGVTSVSVKVYCLKMYGFRQVPSAGGQDGLVTDNPCTLTAPRAGKKGRGRRMMSACQIEPWRTGER
jgi:two-component SAPR family response regulator